MRVSIKTITLTNLEWIVIQKFIKQEQKMRTENPIQDYKKMFQLDQTKEDKLFEAPVLSKCSNQTLENKFPCKKPQLKSKTA